MQMLLKEIASAVDGEVIGDPHAVCTGAAPPSECGTGDLTLHVDGTSLESVEASQAKSIITEADQFPGLNQVLVADPHMAFATIVARFRPPIELTPPASGVDPTAQVDPTARVHQTANIAAGVTIGARTVVMPGVTVMPQCNIGADCVLHAGVTLYEYTRIDDRVTVHASSVIGANGFGYRQSSGLHILAAQLGFVHIESDVELGAGVTIDRGTYGATRIGTGTKIDNQVMIAHNCQIGRHNLICSQVGIAGSCKTGDYVVLAGQVGLKDHIHLGDGTIVGAQAGVMEDCQGNEVLLGSPATAQREQMQIMATERRLPAMRKELKTLRRELDQLRQLLNEPGRLENRKVA